MKITEETVDYISALSRLKLSENERQSMQSQLESIIEYVDILKTADTDSIEPMSHVFEIKNVLREDEEKPSLPRSELLKNAPASAEGAFCVPKTVD